MCLGWNEIFSNAPKMLRNKMKKLRMYKENERAALSRWSTLLKDSVNYGIHRTRVTETDVTSIGQK